MGSDRRRKARARRWSIAVGGALAVHALLYFASVDYRKVPPLHSDDAVELTLVRPEAPRPPPEPKPEPAPPRPAPPSALAPPVRQAPPTPAAPPVPASPPAQPSVARAPPTLQGEGKAPLKLGCAAAGLTGKAKEDCDRQNYQAYMGKPRDERPEYASLGPQGFKPPPPPKPGLHYAPPFGFTIVKSPNDKHFIPYVFGDSKTTVIDKAEVRASDLPTPQQ